MNMRGIRGAIDVSSNEAQKILEATKELLLEMLQKIPWKRIKSRRLFSLRQQILMLLSLQKRPADWDGFMFRYFMPSEINVPGALPRCIRILMLVNSTKTQEEIKHVYLRGASSLRADL